MDFVQIPNLPESDTALVAVSGTYVPILNALRNLGIDVIEINSCQKLNKPVNSHADILLHHLGGNQIVIINGEAYLTEKLHQQGFAVMYSNVCTSNVLYLNDILLNAARVGNWLFAKKTALDMVIRDYCAENRIKLISVKQGYAKCSTVIVNEESIITADKSIQEAAKTVGIDVLQITPGYVQLKGYEYGFLGGACGLISKNKLAFAGNIKTHPDYEKIKYFCNEKQVELISLIDGPLLDVGGILPLKIKESADDDKAIQKLY